MTTPVSARFIVGPSVDGIFPRRTFPHILKEVFKLFPPLANINATANIVISSVAIHICAAILHSSPTPICFSEPHSVSLQPSLIDWLCAFDANTTAGDCGPLQSSKISRCDTQGFRVSAGALAKPHIRPLGFMGKSDHSQSPEVLACEIALSFPRLAGLDFARLGRSSILVLAYGVYGLSSSERPALATSGARAFSPRIKQLSIC